MHCVAIAPAECAAFPWRIHGNLYVTVVVKACLRFDARGHVERATAEPFLEKDRLDADGVFTRVERPSDRVPRRNAADVTLTGHVSGHDSRDEVAVRLRVDREAGPVIDKTLIVRGDVVEGVRRPVGEIPLSYEHAYGGVGVMENPIGCGAEADGRSPNIVDPEDPNRPIGFAPLPSVLPTRRALFGSGSRRDADGEIMNLPDDLDWSYFHAAPRDQRPRQILGDERIRIDGLDGSRPPIDLRLPGIQAAFMAFGLADDPERGRRFQLQLDTLHIDGDARLLVVAGRRELMVDAERAAHLVFVGGYALGRDTVELPKHRPVQIGDTQKLAPVKVSFGTMEIDRRVLDQAPFALASARLAPTSASGPLPWHSDGSLGPLPPMPGADHTLATAPPATSEPRAVEQPAPDYAKTVAKAPVKWRPRDPKTSPDLRDQMLDSRPPIRARPSQAKPVAGAPWSDAASRPVASPVSKQTQTIELELPLMRPVEAQAPVAVEAFPSTAPAAPTPPVAPWSAGPPVEEVAAERAPAPLIPRPRVDVKAMLYRSTLPKIGK